MYIFPNFTNNSSTIKNVSNITIKQILLNDSNKDIINPSTIVNTQQTTEDSNIIQQIAICILSFIIICFCYSNYVKAQVQLEKDKAELKHIKSQNRRNIS